MLMTRKNAWLYSDRRAFGDIGDIDKWIAGDWDNYSRFMDSPAFWNKCHRALRGIPYNFFDRTGLFPTKHRPFLIQPLIDPAQIKCAKKSRQAGITENSVSEVLFLLDTEKMNIVYTFPSPKQVEDFSNTRVKTALESSPYMKRMIGDPQNVTLRQIGKGFLFLRSGTNEKLGEGIDVDCVVFDEIDRMRDNVKVAFQESLSASRFGYVREVSTPTVPGRGVDETWQKSTQQYWYVNCEACGHEQILKWPDNILPVGEEIPFHEKIIPAGSYQYVCAKCHQPRINRMIGRWHPHFASRDIAGYFINQLMCSWITADQIVEKFRNYKFPQLFWNYVLGEVYAEGGRLLTEPMCHRCIDADLKVYNGRTIDYVKIVVGIDFGSLNWGVVLGIRPSGHPDLIGLICTQDDKEPLGSTKKIEEYIRPFNPDCIVADLGYGKDRVTYLIDRFPGRVFGCTYLENSPVVVPAFSEGSHRVTVDRTAWLKSMVSTVRDQKITLPNLDKLYLMPTFVKHLCALFLLLEEDDKGNIIERVNHVGDDHLAHSLGYALMAAEKVGTGAGFKFGFA